MPDVFRVEGAIGCVAGGLCLILGHLHNNIGGQPTGFELLILGGAAVGLYLLNRPTLAVGFVVIAVLNTIHLYALGQT